LHLKDLLRVVVAHLRFAYSSRSCGRSTACERVAQDNIFALQFLAWGEDRERERRKERLGGTFDGCSSFGAFHNVLIDR
jgi:hypothetical protein